MHRSLKTKGVCEVQFSNQKNSRDQKSKLPTLEGPKSKPLKLFRSLNVNDVNLINASLLIKQGNNKKPFLRINLQNNLNDNTDMNI